VHLTVCTPCTVPTTTHRSPNAPVSMLLCEVTVVYPEVRGLLQTLHRVRSPLYALVKVLVSHSWKKVALTTSMCI
jgi:hypothetical protein